MTEGGLRLFTDQQMFDLCERVCTTTVLAGAQEINGLVAGGVRGCDLRCNQLPIDDSGPESLRGLVPEEGLLLQRVDVGCREAPDSDTRLTCPSNGCTLDGSTLIGAQLGLPDSIAELKACTIVEDLANDPGCGNLMLPTEPVCLAPINDPPPITTPWVPVFVPMADGILDDATTVTLFPAGGPPDGVAVRVNGRISVTGRPCPGASCDVGVVVWLSAEPFEFDYSIAGVPTGHLSFEHTTISAQSNFESIRLDSSGLGVLRPEDALGSAQADVFHTIAGVGTPEAGALVLRPSDNSAVFVDWVSGRVTVSGAVSFAEQLARVPPTPAIDAAFELHGTLSALPPVVDVGEDRVSECASETELSADVFDPDGDVLHVTWFERDDDQVERIGSGADVTVAPTLGATEYGAVAVDALGKLGSDSLTVTVEDTTPPEITDLANSGPACLWPPRHDYVVLRVGHEISALVQDACDPAPALEVVSASSHQPDNGVGDGDTTDDVVVFPDRVCLRAERQGHDLGDRIYTVNVVARDASGNTSDPSFQVRVSHDQRPGSDCPHLEDVLFVEEGDPLCDPSVLTTTSLTSSSPNARPAADGCSSTAAPAPLAALLLLLVPWRRRRALLSLAPAILLAACTATPTSPDEVRTCIVDVWFQPERVALSCPETDCVECGADDCKMRSFIWFRSDSVIEGFIIAAASLESFSSAGAPSESQWHLEGDVLVIGERGGSVECSEQTMVWDGRNWERAAPTAAQQFADAHASRDDDGSWRGQPLTLE